MTGLTRETMKIMSRIANMDVIRPVCIVTTEALSICV
jgi:hypothetical protein